MPLQPEEDELSITRRITDIALTLIIQGLQAFTLTQPNGPEDIRGGLTSRGSQVQILSRPHNPPTHQGRGVLGGVPGMGSNLRVKSRERGLAAGLPQLKSAHRDPMEAVGKAPAGGART